MALFILEVKCCGTAFIFGSAGEGWDGPTTPEHLRAPSIYLSIYRLELRRLPPIMGFVGTGVSARAGDPSCLELR